MRKKRRHTSGETVFKKENHIQNIHIKLSKFKSKSKNSNFKKCAKDLSSHITKDIPKSNKQIKIFSTL